MCCIIWTFCISKYLKITELLNKENMLNKEEKGSNNYGIFLRMHISKNKKNIYEEYERVMAKIIRKWKYNYKMKEYAGCLERSEQGYLHVHLYINQFMPIKKIEYEWNEIAELEQKEGNMHMIIVENEEHKKNIFKYIWKAPIRTWICQKYKNEYGWKTGEMYNENEPRISENLVYKKRDNPFSEEKKMEKELGEQESFEGMKKFVPNIGGERPEIFNSQKELEEEMLVKTINTLNKKNIKNYKNILSVIRLISFEFEKYINDERLKSKMAKKLMILNCGYIGLQLEKVKESHYIYFKIGEKILRYYKMYDIFIKDFIKKYFNELNLLKTDSNKEKVKKIFKLLHLKPEYEEYKEKSIQLGVKMYSIFKKVLYVKDEFDNFILKKEILEKISAPLQLELIKKIKYKLPLIEKPVEWGPEIEDFGGWHNIELRKPLVKENINEGHYLKIDHTQIYPIINKLQSVEYQVNKEFLQFVLKNKNQIYEVLLGQPDNSISYKTKKEQYDITLEIAEYMSNYEKFYFTYEMDYRGRLHVLQDYFNYQGNLLARSLIRWANAKPSSNFWLNVALSSLYTGMIGSSNWEMILNFKKNLEKIELTNWYEHFKKAKEPILWLSLFFELKTNAVHYECKYIIWFDATCSGSQLISMLLADKTYMLELNMQDGDKVYDYYTSIYNKYGKFPGIEDIHARKIIKKVVMTINYGLTRLGCHRYFKFLLMKYNYCKNKSEYKEKWKDEVNKFYSFLEELPFVKDLEVLQEIWTQFCKKGIVFSGFKIGENGFNQSDFCFVMRTFCYKKYYKNLSLYNKSRKMKEKGFKYLWHNKTLDKREQKRKIKANLIHMLDAVWNIFVCSKFQNDIACIHDCHGIHSCDYFVYFDVVRDVFIKMFKYSDQYYYLLVELLKDYLKQTNDKEYYDNMIDEISIFKKRIIDKYIWYKLKKSKYMFIPK